LNPRTLGLMPSTLIITSRWWPGRFLNLGFIQRLLSDTLCQGRNKYILFYLHGDQFGPEFISLHISIKGPKVPHLIKIRSSGELYIYAKGFTRPCILWNIPNSVVSWMMLSGKTTHCLPPPVYYLWWIGMQRDRCPRLSFLSPVQSIK
jgi:hypothetical protein